MGKMHKRLAKSIRKFGQYDDDAESLAAYLIARGWRDTEKRPRVQQVTVIPSPTLQALTQVSTTQLPDFRSMPVDHQKTNYLKG